jgi:orotidine-5'-phosphate decarboxylase
MNAIIESMQHNRLTAMRLPKDYIIFPLDVPNREAAVAHADLLKDSVGMFKIGLELFVQAGAEMITTIGEQTRAPMFLDLKLHDIPATVERAMAVIASLGVRFATVHCGENFQMLEAAVAGSRGEVAVLGVTVLTSVGAADIRRAGYRQEFVDNLDELVLQRASDAKNAGCAGVVCSGREASLIKSELGTGFLTVTPGIRPQWSLGSGDDQRRATTPVQAIQAGSDYLVIGRPIRDADDPVKAAEKVADEVGAALKADRK